MLDRFHRISLLLLVAVAAGLAIGLWLLNWSFLVEPIHVNNVTLTKSVAALAKDALFVPLKPLMYALIIMSIGSSIAISRGGLGAKFTRVFGFFLAFSLLGMACAIIALMLFPNLDIGLADPATVSGDGALKDLPFAIKLYGVFTSELMVCSSDLL
jgi:hypothetical protein